MKKAVVVLPLISLFLVSFSLPVHSNPVDDCIWQNLDDHGPIMLLIDPEKGSVEYGNQAAAAFFGYPADALAGLPLAELTAGSLDELAAIWEEALAQEENSFVLERRLASGETRAVEIYVYPYRLEGREMFFSIIHDITEEKQLAARERLMAAAYFMSLVAIIGCLLFINHLRKPGPIEGEKCQINLFNELRRGFMNAIDGFIYLRDENLRYVFANRAMEEFYQLGEEEIVGRDDYDLSPAGFAEKIRQTDLAVLQEQRLIVDQIEWGGRVLKTTKFPVRLETGEYGVGAYIQDVTADYNRQRAEEKRQLRNAILADILGRNFSSTEEQLEHALHEALRLTESQYGTSTLQ